MVCTHIDSLDQNTVCVHYHSRGHMPQKISQKQKRSGAKKMEKASRVRINRPRPRACGLPTRPAPPLCEAQQGLLTGTLHLFHTMSATVNTGVERPAAARVLSSTDARRRHNVAMKRFSLQISDVLYFGFATGKNVRIGKLFGRKAILPEVGYLISL